MNSPRRHPLQQTDLPPREETTRAAGEALPDSPGPDPEADPTAGRSHSFTLRALERMAAEGLLRPLGTHSALDRATDRLSTDFGALDTLSA